MEFNWITLFGVSVGLMTVLFFMYFFVRAASCYHDSSSNFGRILAGSLVAGVGSGVILGVGLGCVLPTHYYITSPTPDGHYTRYVLDSEFENEYGRLYIINLTDEDYYLCAMTYGTSTLSDDEQSINPIPSGYIVETKHKVNEWFKPFPEQVRSENKGETKWHVLNESQAKKEFE